MEKYIQWTQGEYNLSHVKQGIIVRSGRSFVGLVTESPAGYVIKSPDGSTIGGEPTVNHLMKRFNSYSFYSL